MKELQEMRIYRPNPVFWTWQWKIIVRDCGIETTYYSEEEYDDPAVALKAMLEVGAVVT